MGYMVVNTGDASVPSLPNHHPRPYGIGGTFFSLGGFRAASPAFGPPADDAAEKHEDAAKPDEYDERIDEDANGGLREAVPVSEEDVQVGQVMRRNRNLTGRLVVKIRIEVASRVDILLQ